MIAIHDQIIDLIPIERSRGVVRLTAMFEPV